LVEFLAVLPSSPTTVPKPKAIRKPPDARFVKINFDGAISGIENRSGIGVVVYDHIGAILVSLA